MLILYSPLSLFKTCVGCVAELECDQTNGQSMILTTVELKSGYLYYWEVHCE